MAIVYGIKCDQHEYDVCIVGAGPLGLAVARECEMLGKSVIVLEAGSEQASSALPANMGGSVVDRRRHAPLEIVNCFALGGSTWWWGGRCVPMDPIDFVARPFVGEPAWPIGPEHLEPYYDQAAGYLDCGSAVFSDPHPDWAALGGGIDFSALERWSRTREAAIVHGDHLRTTQTIDVCLETFVSMIEAQNRLVTGIQAEHAGQTRLVKAHNYVLACGGIQTTRLLQLFQLANFDAFGGREGALGHYYMGHTRGIIADVVLTDPNDIQSADFYLDQTGTWVRRRFSVDMETQLENSILNTIFWIDNPYFRDARHRSGILSAVYLALSFPQIGRLLLPEGIRLMHVADGGDYLQHFLNILLSPLETLASAWHVLRGRYLLKPRKPGFVIRNKTGRYALTYHGEQAPRRDSQACLTKDKSLLVDLVFSEIDAISVVKAHELLDKSLRAAGKGQLEYHMPSDERVAAVMEQASDGYHQEGLLRMGLEPETSVVDMDCRVHDYENLYIASSGVFPTSGQANPTFSACALAVRLARHIAAKEPKS